VRSTVTSYADQRVQVISQRVMTTQNLLSIIHRYDLYRRQQSREPREKLIERMRDDIQFKMVSADVVDPRSGAPRKATIAFTVSYTSDVPDTAAKVANELTTLYLNENLTERNRLAQDAYGFLQSEGDRLSTQIEELETKLAAFKSKHLEELPELAQVNMQQLERVEQEARDAELRRTSLDQQRVFLEAQFAQLKPDSAVYSDTGERIFSTADRLKALRSRLASAEALYAPDHPDVVRMKREVAGLEAEVGTQSAPVVNDLRRTLEQTRGELADAKKKYSEDHPDVQRLEHQVAQLEAQLAAPPGGRTGADPPTKDGVPTTGEASPGAANDSAAVESSAVPPRGIVTTVPDNPAYIQIAAQLDAVRNDLRAQDGVIARLKTRTADLAHKLSLAPEVEKDYHDLTRDYDSAQLKYRDIRAKQMEAQVAENLESDRKGERFTLIEPPLPPENPVSPNRPLVFVLGLLLSLALAGGAVALLEAVDTTVRHPKDMLEAFSAPLLVVVPRIMTAADIALGRRRVRYVVSTLAAVGFAAAVAVHVLYRPLDVLWFAAMRHLGF
jgi:polysaccharide biosynthesis transport protein